MGKEKLKNKRGVLLLTNRLGKFERLNHEEWKILVNGTVQGLAPVAVVEKRRALVLQVQAENWTPLSVYMANPMDAETALSFIWNTLRIAFDCERHGLRTDNISWDPQKVFVDPQGNLQMVYWPITTLDKPQYNALMFYYGFCGILYDSGIDRQIADMYYGYFYQRAYFDMSSFYRMVQDVLDRWRNLQRKVRKEDERRKREQPFDDLRPDRSVSVATGYLERVDTGEEIWLTRSKTVFGRDPTACDVPITGVDNVSRRHGAIINRDDQYYAVDLGSKNGTFVETHRLREKEKVLLVDGHTVRFGNAAFVFRQSQQNGTIHIHQMQRRDV